MSKQSLSPVAASGQGSHMEWAGKEDTLCCKGPQPQRQALSAGNAASRHAQGQAKPLCKLRAASYRGGLTQMEKRLVALSVHALSQSITAHRGTRSSKC